MQIHDLKYTALAVLLMSSGVAYAQPGGGVRQFGAVTANDCTSWLSNNVIQDAGACPPAGGGFPITLGSTSIAANSTTTSVTGLSIAAGASNTLAASTFNGQAITTGTGTLTLGSATLNAGAGGTLASMAYQASTAVSITGGAAALTTGLSYIPASGNATVTIGQGTTGTNAAVAIFNGGSGTAGGGNVQFQSNGVFTGGVGNQASLFGSGTATTLTLLAPASTNIQIWANNSQTVVFNTQLTSCTGVSTTAGQVISCTVSAKRFKNQEGYLNPNTAYIRSAHLRTALFSYKNPKRFDALHHIGFYADDVCVMDERLCNRLPDGSIQGYDERGVIAYLWAAQHASIWTKVLVSVGLK